MWKRIVITCGLLYLPFLILTLIWTEYQKGEQLSGLSYIQKKNIQNKNYHLVDLCQSLIYNTKYWSGIKYPDSFGQNGFENSFMKPYLKLIEGAEDYDQFRFIDIHGNEFLRYQRNSEGRMVQGELQSKANREYFGQGLLLRKGQIFLSPIELNKEFGEIEIPHKPVLRGVGPIYNMENEQLGLVVINFKMSRIFNRLKPRITADNFYFVDGNLNIITSNVSTSDLAFQTTMTANDSLLRARLNISGLKSATDTSFTENGSLWVYENVHLGLDDELDLLKDSPEIVTNNSWGIIQEVPPTYLKKRFEPLYRNFVIFNGITILLITLIAVGYARNQNQKKHFHNELQNKNKALLKSKEELETSGRLLKEANRQLQVRNKQLEEFNYVVAHNLKAPVSSMSVIVGMLRNARDHDMFLELFPKLESIAQSISTLIEDVHSYVSILNQQKIVFEDINIRILLDNLRNEFAETLLEVGDDKFHVLYKLDAWKTITSSRFFMKSILQNFLSNAIKYRRANVRSHVIFESGWENGKKVLYIRDNGLGINLERHGKNLFKLYTRFHRNISGKGMGLFIVKSQLGAINATLNVESQEGRGTTFKIKFH
jgi:signal transduction histidine kinase